MQKQFIVNGQIKEGDEGFYFLLKVSCTDLNNEFVFDSRDVDGYFSTKEEANEDMILAGRGVTAEIAAFIEAIFPNAQPMVIDKTLLH